MPKLPMHPLLFLLLYAVLGVSATLADGVSVTHHFGHGISEANWLFLSGFHLYWTFRAVSCARQISGSRRYYAKVTNCLIALAVILTIALSHEVWWGALVTPKIDYFIGVGVNVIGSAGALLFFAIFWFAASAVCEADVKSSSFGSTFLAFIYLPLGVFFIYPRLKRALAAASEPNLLRGLP